MMPVGPMMIEHRLIERMIRVVAARLEALGRSTADDLRLVDAAVDFIRMYADRCHHGKEEDILFRELAKKELSPELKKTMDELIAEHKQGRATVKRLVEARERYAAGDASAVDAVRKELRWLTEFYPTHIKKEDKRFFLPAMEYFTKEEKDAMLREGYAFDQKLIHEKYRGVVEAFEPPGK
jgi:hemerythrin-like domain-containing protein